MVFGYSRSQELVIKVGLFGYSKKDELKKIWHILHAQLFGFYLYIENKQYSDHFVITDKVPLLYSSSGDTNLSDKSVILFKNDFDAREYMDAFKLGKGDKDVTTIAFGSYDFVYRIETLIDLVTRVEKERTQKNAYYHHSRCEHFLSNSPQKISMYDSHLARLFNTDYDENNIEYKGITEHLWDSHWGNSFFTKEKNKDSS